MSASDTIKKILPGRINLLIVEDDESLLSMLTETFSVPCIHVMRASNMKEAKKAIALHGATWHCWIVDMCLGEKVNAGAALIEEHNNFPFAIVYSGLGSMESAACAIQKGAAAVIDKGADTLEKLIGEACNLMPLGVLCNGVIHKKKELLFLLKEHTIRDPREWAEKGGMTLRQMENISLTATGLPPSYTIPFYYGLRYLLLSSLDADRQIVAAEDSDFCLSCIDYLENNLAYYQDKLFL